MAKIGQSVETAQSILLSGGLAAIPTETVYGLAAVALLPEAVLSIFEVKQRPSFDPLIIHIADINQLQAWVTDIPLEAYKLMNSIWPGPLTILLPKKSIIPDLVTSGLPQVAVRIPNHPLTLQLLRTIAVPLAAPSANPFGYISPTTAAHVENQLGHKIPYILDGGPCEVGIESTIIGWENNRAVIYRLGGLALDHIIDILGYQPDIRKSTSKPAAPGMLESHYAPKHPLFLGKIEDLFQRFPTLKAGLLNYNQLRDYPESLQKVLTWHNDLREASKNLFSYLREMDSWEIDCIFAELAPELNLGLAINDRLHRAATLS